MYRKMWTKDVRQPSGQKPAQESDAVASLPRRIGGSASGLLKESFEQPPTRSVTGVLASFDTKAGSSSSSKGTDESSLAFCSSSQYQTITSDQGESFRSIEKGGEFGRTYGQVAFDEFLAGPNEFEHEPGSVQDRPGLVGDKQRGFTMVATEDHLRGLQGRETRRRQDENQDSVGHDSDGAAVIALLSDPAFTMDEEPSSALEPETDGAEGRSYERLQTGKGLAESVAILHLSSPLDLIPDFGAPWNPNDAVSKTRKRIHERGQLLESGLGEIQPWIDILDRYHGEVWGDMLPLVKEAREELKAASGRQTMPRDGPAIQRLTMVLQHLGYPKN